MIYLVAFIFILFFYLIRKKKSNMIFEYFFCFSILVLIAGLRYRVGGDSLAYEYFFSDYPKINELHSFDIFNAQYQPSWYVFNAFVKSVSNNFMTFQLIHALIINSIVFWFINKYTREKWLTLIYYFVFYYFYFNMEILRETLAISVFLISVPFLLNKKWIKYGFFCILATSFHISAYITFLFPFLLRELKIWQYVAVYFIAFTLFYFTSPEQIVASLNLSGIIQVKASSYSSIEVSIYGFLIQLIKLLPILVITIIRRKNKLEPHIFDKFINIYIILGVFTMFIAGFYRFLNYLSILSIIYIVDTIVLLRKQKRVFLKSYIMIRLMVVLLFINQIYYFVRPISRDNVDGKFHNLYLPYYSVFNPKTDPKRESLFNNYRVY